MVTRTHSSALWQCRPVLSRGTPVARAGAASYGLGNVSAAPECVPGPSPLWGSLVGAVVGLAAYLLFVVDGRTVVAAVREMALILG